jgi:DNA-binding transcriptional LysR family regulator
MAMNITLEQARTLSAVARLGSFAKAAAELRKVHTAVLYAVKQLEEEVGLTLVDRSGYRATLTPLGRRVLEHCERMLAAEGELARFCETARLGHEPSLVVVYDGLLPVAPILTAVRAASEASPATRIALFSEYLGDVEARAAREQAGLVLAVVPLQAPLAEAVKLAPLPSVLVAAKGHPLTQMKRLSAEALAAHPYLTVRGSDQRLRMSTSPLDKVSEFRMSDFHAKRVALLAGMGWGWMPEYLVTQDLARKRLVVLGWGERGRHIFEPVLHRRHAAGEAGPATTAFVGALVGTPQTARGRRRP